MHKKFSRVKSCTKGTVNQVFIVLINYEYTCEMSEVGIRSGS